MTIHEAQNFVYHWIKEVGVRYFNEFTNTVILTEEVGELASIMARIYGEQSFKDPEKEKTAKSDLGDEMADVLFVLICLANQTGIDLTKAFIDKMERKTLRDKSRHHSNEKLK
jgi:NTP pyrophosphatase (non-canonical NTP hydrolase)